MKQAFPIANNILSAEEWDMLIDDFFALHDARTFQVWKLPFEFYRFVSEQSYGIRFNKPYLSDLLHFEWIEIEVHTMADQQAEPYLKNGDVKNDLIEVNKEYRLIRLSFPVHLFAAEESKKHTGSYYLLVYRHSKTFEVRFADLSELNVLFFDKITVEKKTIGNILKEIGEATGIDQVPMNEIEKNIMGFAKIMFDEKVFIGYKRLYKN
jgi:hypothetical protein